jgi:hypothetical protein
MARKRLGDVLLEQGLIDEADLQEALRYKERSGYRLGTALVALRLISDWQLAEALSQALELPLADLTKERVSREALRLIPARLAERFDLLPLRLEQGPRGPGLVLAMSDPQNQSVLRRMQDIAGLPVRPVLAALPAIQRAIQTHYRGLTAAEFESAEPEPTHEQTIHALLREAEALVEPPADDRAEPAATAPTPAVAPPAGQRTLALEIRFRALLHLMLKKNLITGRDYAESLQHLLQALGSEVDPGRPRD